MDREEAWTVLQSCILFFDGTTLDQLKQEGFEPELMLIGIKLARSLQEMEVSHDN